MKSMTGHGYKETKTNTLDISVEMKGYNSRFLETCINVPPYLTVLEQRIRERITQRCERGKIEVTIRFKEINSDVCVEVDTHVAQAYYQAILKIAQTLGIDEKPRLATILGMEGVLQINRVTDPERYWQALEPVFLEVLKQFDEQRVREGKCTESDILHHISTIEKALEIIQKNAPEIEAYIKENLRARFMEVLGNEVDEKRILAETAVLLMKYTISEEITRLSSHLNEFKAEIIRNPAPAKKLDFLAQEMNREINTIGSKTPLLEVSQAVVTMKDALENVREQLRNVE
jgi:uncharacterized protein (TIGR00255 family)